MEQKAGGSLPTKLGSYEIVAPLKSGGMATLYLARRAGAAGFQRLVAIKVVHSHLARDPAFSRMFVDEALLSARIVHPNVVHVEELADEGGMLYLVMEYVHGCSLSQLMAELARKRRRFTPELATWLAIQLADGLHAAHETVGDDGQPLGVVHRDVSPQNVLLSYRGHVKVIDFGIAKAAGRSQKSRTGILKGKLRYMAPEQAFGRDVDRRADTYALGVMLWEMLTMRRLFNADNDLALIDIVRAPKVERPSVYNAAIGPALDSAVMHALAPEADQRPATAQDLRRRLAEALPGALAIEASHMAGLLADNMSEQIEKDRASLPSTIVRALGKDRPSATNIPAVIPGVPRAAVPELVESASEVRLEFLDDDVSSPGGATPDLPESQTRIPAPASRSKLYIALGVGALVVAAGAAALLIRRGAPQERGIAPAASTAVPTSAAAPSVAPTVPTPAASTPAVPTPAAPVVQPAAPAASPAVVPTAPVTNTATRHAATRPATQHRTPARGSRTGLVQDDF